MKPGMKWAIVILAPIVVVFAVVFVLRSNMDSEMSEAYKAGSAAEKISDGYREIAFRKQMRNANP